MEETLKLISQNLLSKSYLNLEEIRQQFQSDELSLNDILENLNEIFSKIGLILEIIEFNEENYVVVSLENATNEFQFEKSVYSILTILAHLVSIKGNSIPLSTLVALYSKYKYEFEILEQNRLIEINESPELQELLFLTPLGANLISPVIPKFQELLKTTDL